jgi:hypothetical protein
MKTLRLADILAEIGRLLLLNASPECYRYTNLIGLNAAAFVNYSELYIHKVLLQRMKTQKLLNFWSL